MSISQLTAVHDDIDASIWIGVNNSNGYFIVNGCP